MASASKYRVEQANCLGNLSACFARSSPFLSGRCARHWGGGWVGWCSVRARRGGLGVGGVVLPPSTLTVGVLCRFFESALTRWFSGFVIES